MEIATKFRSIILPTATERIDQFLAEWYKGFQLSLGYDVPNDNFPKRSSSVKLVGTLIKPNADDPIGKILRDIEILEKRIDNEYKGSCFDLTYKELIEKCCQYQQQLDDIDVTGKPVEKSRRKNGIIKAEEAAKVLNSKTHKNGKPCPRCP